SLSFSKIDMTNRLIHSSNSTLNNGLCKSLVVYLSPTSLGSTLKYKGFSSKLREMCQIPVHLQSIILGVLLSDGWLYKNKSGKTLFCLKQTNFEYLWLVYIKFSHYCRSLPSTTKTNIRGKKFTSVMFATRVYPCFTEWYNIFYQEGKKVVPLDLYNMLTYEALAHWIMGDGTKVYKGLTLQTQSFTVKECVFIISILIHKFNLKCSLHMQRNQPTIYISSKSMEKLRPLINPYICSSMRYKIGVDSQ
uniref:LAGLIDADG endonuclease n=1 Tax=Daedalea confragosa TaxID=2028083 RepID=UPI002A80A58C